MWRRRRDPQLAAQPVGQPLVDGERGRPVQPHHQIPVRLFGHRVERHPSPQMRERGLGVRGRLGQPGEQRALRLAVAVAQGDDPVLVQSGEQVAATQRERLLVAAGGDQRCELRGVGPTSSSPAVSRPATRCSPATRRTSASAPRRLVRALSSSTSGQNRAASAPRGCGPGLSARYASSARARRLAGGTDPSSSSSPSTRTRSMARHYRAAITVASRNDHGARGACAP